MTVVNNDSGQQTSLDKLVVVRLLECRRCSRLPTLGQLPVLKTLVIDGMEAVRQIGKEFYTQSEGNRNGVRPDSSSGTQERIATARIIPLSCKIEDCWLPLLFSGNPPPPG
ncbi:hypothetical protein Dimus_027479 [Dionaea muscipula]